MVDRIMPPKDVYIEIVGNCECVIRLQMELRLLNQVTLRGGNYPGLSTWAYYITTGSLQVKESSQRVGVRDRELERCHTAGLEDEGKGH